MNLFNSCLPHTRGLVVSSVWGRVLLGTAGFTGARITVGFPAMVCLPLPPDACLVNHWCLGSLNSFSEKSQQTYHSGVFFLYLAEGDAAKIPLLQLEQYF